MAEGGEEVFVEVVAVVLERAFTALPGGDERLEPFQPRFSQLGEREAAGGRRELAGVGLAGEQVALPARLSELDPTVW